MASKRIKIKGTNKTPTVVFDLDEGLLKIMGRSTTKNPQEFYIKIIRLLETYCVDPKAKTLLILDLEAYNPLSTRFLYKIVQLVSEIELIPECRVKVNWYYDPYDIDIKNDIYLCSKIVQFKINAISYETAEVII